MENINNKLKSNFYNSIINEFKLVNHNIDKIPEEKKAPFDFYDIRDLFLIYVNWRKRFIGPGYRKVVYSQELKDKLSKNKKLKKIINKLEYKFKNNEDITPFLTKNVANKPYMHSTQIKGDKDLLLNTFGIQHFHLDEMYNNRAVNNIKFSMNSNLKRSSELLYALLKKDKVYFIDINNHEFYHKEILLILKNNWEYLIERYEMKLGIPVNEHSYEDSIELLKSGINSSIKLDDKYYIFGPISIAGTENLEFFHAKKFFVDVQKQYNELMNNKLLVIDKINKISSSFTRQNDLDINILLKNGLLFFIDKISNFTIKFEENEIFMSHKYCEIGYHTYDFNS